MRAAARTRPALAATAGYLAFGVLVLGRSIRPGRTLVPADLLGALPPYRGLAPAVGHNQILSDPAFQFFPWFRFLGDSLRHSGIPQWNPLILGGVRFTPNGYVSPYYPLFWLVRLLSPLNAYNLFVFLHLVIAALGVYVFARLLGARPLAAWIAGLFVFTADFWIHWSLHLVHLVAFALLPWSLVTTHLAITRPSPRSAAALAAVVGLWLLGGNPQYVYYGALATGGYGIALLARRRIIERRRLFLPALTAATGLVLGLGIAAATLLPSAAATSTILRTHETADVVAKTVVPRGEAVRLLVPDSIGNPADHVDRAPSPELHMDSPFVGVTVILLFAAAIGARRPRWLLVAGAGGALLLAFAGTPNHLLYDVLPGYDRFRVSARWLAVLPAFALPAAALGLDTLLSGERRSRLVALATALGCAGIVGAWYARSRAWSGVPPAYFGHRALWALGILGLTAVAVVACRWRPRAAVAVFAACAIAEVLFHTPRWYPIVDSSRAYPQVAPARLAHQRGGRIARVAPGPPDPFPSFGPDVPMTYGVADVQGWDGFFPKDADRYLRLIEDYGSFAKDQNQAPTLRDPKLLRSPLVDALDVRTVLSDVGGAGLSQLSAGPPAVYARSSPGGARLVPRAERVTTAEMWRRIAEPGWNPSDVAFVTGLPRPITGSGGTVRGGRTSSDTERWLVDAPGGGFLLVSGAYDDGWRASVDGRSVRTEHADGLFRGVSVAPGRHVVRFLYRNPDEERGRRLTVVSVGALVVLVLVPHAARRRQGRNRPSAR